MSAIEQLPTEVSDLELSALELSALERSANAHEKRLSRLFRRWPSLSEVELAELKRLHEERILIAKYIGRRRRPQAAR